MSVVDLVPSVTLPMVGSVPIVLWVLILSLMVQLLVYSVWEILVRMKCQGWRVSVTLVFAVSMGISRVMTETVWLVRRIPLKIPWEEQLHAIPAI